MNHTKYYLNYKKLCDKRTKEKVSLDAPRSPPQASLLEFHDHRHQLLDLSVSLYDGVLAEYVVPEPLHKETHFSARVLPGLGWERVARLELDERAKQTNKQTSKQIARVRARLLYFPQF